jgi:16S rRNA processing protein RimM
MLLVVGRVSRPHAIRGDVVVEIRTDDPERRFASGCVLATQPEVLGPLTVTEARPHAGGLIVSFAGVSDRDAAERLRGVLLVIDSADVPAPEDPDEFHDHQLIGLDVVTAGGRHIGTVADIRHHGQDLLVIRPCPGEPTGESGTAVGGAGVAPGAGGAPGGGAGRGPVSATAAAERAAEILVPFVAAIVPEVDLQAGRLIIDPPPGLLDQDAMA